MYAHFAQTDGLCAQSRGTPLTTVKFAGTPDFHCGEGFWTDVERMKGSVLSNLADVASLLYLLLPLMFPDLPQNAPFSSRRSCSIFLEKSINRRTFKLIQDWQKAFNMIESFPFCSFSHEFTLSVTSLFLKVPYCEKFT